MEQVGDTSVGEVFSSEIVDVTELDVQQVLAAGDTPLALCVRRLIQRNSRTASTVAGFDNFLGEDEHPDVV